MATRRAVRLLAVADHAPSCSWPAHRCQERCGPRTASTWWSESRPEEGGRIQIVRLDAERPARRPAAGRRVGPHPRARVRRRRVVGAPRRRLLRRLGRPAPLPARPRCRSRSRSHRSRPSATAGATPTVAARPTAAGSSASGSHTKCSTGRTPATRSCATRSCALPADGSAPPTVLVTGPDFVAAPRISRDGRQLAWLTWDHPDMPWDGTELWVGHLHEVDGSLRRRRRPARGRRP